MTFKVERVSNEERAHRAFPPHPGERTHLGGEGEEEEDGEGGGGADKICRRPSGGKPREQASKQKRVRASKSGGERMKPVSISPLLPLALPAVVLSYPPSVPPSHFSSTITPTPPHTHHP